MVQHSMRTVSASLLIALALFATGAQAQPQSDREGVRAALDAFHAALSARDIDQMEGVWAHEPYVMLAHPRDKHITIGWDAAKKHLQTLFSFWSDLKVSRRGEPHIHVAPPVAWVSVINDVQGRRTDGQLLSFSVIATAVLEKRGDRWVFVSHHASRVPD